MKYDDNYISRMKSELHAKYGVQMDSSIIVMMIELKEQVEKDSLVLQKAENKLKVSQKVFQPTNDRQVVLFGLSTWGIPSIIMAFLFVSIYYFKPTSTYSKLNAICDTVIIRNDSTFGYIKFGEEYKNGKIVNGYKVKDRFNKQVRYGNDLYTEIYFIEK